MTLPLTPPTQPGDAARAAGAAFQTLLRSASDAARTSQTIGIEWVYFAKTAYEQSSAAARKLAKADSPAAALQIQADYAKGAFERFAAQTATFRDLYASLAEAMTGGAPAAPARKRP